MTWKEYLSDLGKAVAEATVVMVACAGVLAGVIGLVMLAAKWW